MSRWIIAAALIAGLPSTARAHFYLNAPPSWWSQDLDGLPEKAPPCGNESYPGSSASGVVSAYHPGDAVTVTITEKIFHPGHYRIALAPDQSQLPPDPPYDADGGGGYPCGTAFVEDPVLFPVLADNVFPHTQPFSAAQTTTVTLPANFTCTQCTLQVIEFMSQHPLNVPGGCYYHHCATLSIRLADGGLLPDAGWPPTDGGPSTTGCACSAATGSFPWVALLAAGLAATAWAAARVRRGRLGRGQK